MEITCHFRPFYRTDFGSVASPTRGLFVGPLPSLYNPPQRWRIHRESSRIDIPTLKRSTEVLGLTSIALDLLEAYLSVA
jgi:hypothetical protein